MGKEAASETAIRNEEIESLRFMPSTSQRAALACI
jgi:hypothetical protein